MSPVKAATFIAFRILPLAALLFCAACPVSDENTELPWTYPPNVVDKLELTNGDKVRAALSITGEQNPLLALNYRLGSANGPYYFDYVVLCAAKMVTVTRGSAIDFNLDLGEIQSILDKRTTLLAPLQTKGIKVLMQITNNGEGFSFANLPYTLRQPFAKTVHDIMVSYNLDGLEFNDINGGTGAYPALGVDYYDPAFDDRAAHDQNHIGDRISIGAVSIPADETDESNPNTIPLTDDQKLDYFWHQGGYNYANLLTYFRPLVESPNTPTTAVIGEKDDKPIWVRETGFAAGHDESHTVMDGAGNLGELFGVQKSYIAAWIKDYRRPELQFTAVTDMAGLFISPTINGQPFGWHGTGVSIMEFVTHLQYSPGVLDLSAATDEQLQVFSRRFAEGNMDNSDDATAHGDPYGLLYYANVGTGDAAKLSITSRLVYGGRREEGVFLIGLDNDGPEVVYTAR